MSWKERLKTAAYVSPSGTRYVFKYEDVGFEYEKKNTEYTFPLVKGSYIQDYERGGRKFPLRLYFLGSECDLESERFQSLLSERGIGKLEHPLYRTINVVPFGAIIQRDDLKSSANQSIIELIFAETLLQLYISDGVGDINDSIDAFNRISNQQLELQIFLDTVASQVDFNNFWESLADASFSGLITAAGSNNELLSQLYNTERNIQNRLIATGVIDVDTVASQSNILTQLPASSTDVSSADKVNIYAANIDYLLSTETLNSNQNYALDFFIASTLCGILLSAVTTESTLKSDIINNVLLIESKFMDWVDWRDGKFDDVGDRYTFLYDLITKWLGYLVNLSYAQKTEYAMILTSSRSIVDLCGQLYKDVDANLDFFIETNNFSGSELLEIPKGRRIVYYL